MNQAKIKEAEALMKSAKKAHTKSITKWSADWDHAATDYDKAAQIYTHMGHISGTKEAWEAASHAHEKAGNLFFAARALENLATFLNDHKAEVEKFDAMQLVDYSVRAAKFYAFDNKPEKQASALVRASRFVPSDKVNEATNLLISGLDALEMNEKQYLTLDVYRALLLMQVRAGQPDEAIKTLKREMKTFERLEQPANAAKAGLEAVVICLSLGDYVLAEREFKEFTQMYGFAHSKEQAAAYDLLSAFEERDEEKLEELKKEGVYTFITSDISRMVKKLKISAGNVGLGAKSKRAKDVVPAGEPVTVTSGQEEGQPAVATEVKEKAPAPLPPQPTAAAAQEPDDEEDIR